MPGKNHIRHSEPAKSDESTFSSSFQPLPPDCVTIREVGGALAPLWHSYIEPGRTRALLYVVDASAPEALGAATLHLVELLAQPGLEGAPALVVFAKTDVKPAALNLREVNKSGIEHSRGLLIFFRSAR